MDKKTVITELWKKIKFFNLNIYFKPILIVYTNTNFNLEVFYNIRKKLFIQAIKLD